MIQHYPPQGILGGITRDKMCPPCFPNWIWRDKIVPINRLMDRSIEGMACNEADLGIQPSKCLVRGLIDVTIGIRTCSSLFVPESLELAGQWSQYMNRKQVGCVYTKSLLWIEPGRR